MIKTYVQIDERVRPLAKIIKYWTKRRILNDAGEHSLVLSDLRARANMKQPSEALSVPTLGYA